MLCTLKALVMMDIDRTQTNGTTISTTRSSCPQSVASHSPYIVPSQIEHWRLERRCGPAASYAVFAIECDSFP